MSIAAYIALVCASRSSEAPRVLIVQTSGNKGAESVPMADVFATVLDEDHRVTPVVWENTDPIFNAALINNELGTIPANPSRKDMFSIAAKLHADYLAVVTGAIKSDTAQGKIWLFKNQREVFKDDQTIGVQRGGKFDLRSSLRSIGRTWSDKLNKGAFKGLEPAVKVQPVEMTAPQVTPAEPVAAAPVDNSALANQAQNIRNASEREIEQLKRTTTPGNDLTPIVDDLRRGRDQAIVAMFRDAIDAEPLDFTRRKMLFDVLLPQDPKLAAQEARRAAKVLPENVELRLLAARAWLSIHEDTEAQTDLNEAIVRDPNSVNVRMMLAEIALGKLDAAGALDHAEKAVKQQDSSSTRRMRAMCRALLGGIDGVKTDLAAAKEPVTVDQFNVCAKVLDASLDDSVSALRSLTQRAVVRRKDEAVQEGIDTLSRTLTSRTAFVDGTVAPVTSRVLFDKLLLAYKLLQQSVIDLRDYVNNGTEDSLNDSKINLSESIRMLTESRGRKL